MVIRLIVLFATLWVASCQWKQSESALSVFMNWYKPSQGVWEGHLSYPPDWCRANGLEAVANFMLTFEAEMDQATEDYLWQVLKEVQDNQGDKFYQTAEYFDDILWWSLAYSRAYEVALSRNDTDRATRFLSTAININNVVYKDSWTNSTCNGGVFWSRAFSYKNAITNELFIVSAARLARITDSDDLWSRASNGFDWFMKSGMLKSNNLIVDGLSSTCQPTGAVYTYNQGVILGALTELYTRRDEASLIQQGAAIAASVQMSLTDEQGVLSEVSCGDGALFKGIYTRYLRYFMDQSKDILSDNDESLLQQFLQVQAQAVWASDRDLHTGHLGKKWAGPPDYKFHNLQISGLDAFTAAAAQSVSSSTFHLPSQEQKEQSCSGHGEAVQGECVCDIRYSGSSCELQSTWATFYDKAQITLTSSDGRLLCVSSSSTTTEGSGRPAVVSTCLDDSLAAQAVFTCQTVNSTAMRLLTASGSYLQVTSSGQLSTVSAPDSGDQSVVFLPEIVASPVESNPLHLDLVALAVLAPPSSSSSLSSQVYVTTSGALVTTALPSDPLQLDAKFAFRTNYVQSCN